MKKILRLSFMLFACLVLAQSSKAQEPLKLQYYKRLAVKFTNPDPLSIKHTFINENGWMFVRYIGPFDSLELDNFKIDKRFKATCVFAFDQTGKLRWEFTYDEKNTVSGFGMGILMSGADNSLYFSCVARDSIVLNNGFREIFDIPNRPYIFMGKFDSTGNVVKLFNATLGQVELANFSVERYYNFGLLMSSYNLRPMVLDSTFKIVAHYPIPGGNSSTIDMDTNGYFSFVKPPTTSFKPKDSLIILDTVIYASNEGKYKWVVSKVTRDGTGYKRLWTHVVENNRDNDIQENKVLKVDREGNVFWAIRHAQDLTIAGHVIPFYKDASSFVTKASIIRFDKNGNFKSAHYDTTQQCPFPGLTQTIWLEYDKDMNVYAYLYSGGRTYTFDRIDFDSTYSHAHKIMLFDQNSKTFNKAYTHVGGRFDMSLSPPRFVFWHSLNSNNYWFLEDIRIQPKWDGDFGVAVMDTMRPKYPISVPNIQSEHAFVNIYPNPSDNNFIIHNTHSKQIECVVYSVDMREQEKFKVGAGEKFELSSIVVPGFYFIRCTDGLSGFQTFKMVKM
ncbi:MAG: T9SS type A sorting domain-containing protein [Bacteroidia bacterium]|nr:T9SS type A sorting domain-containing protein [Bacteroidia bacterium]